MVTVFTKPNCVECERTKSTLERGGIAFESIDLFANREALKKVKELGFKAAPVVITDDGEKWSGYRPDRLSALIAGSESADDIWA